MASLKYRIDHCGAASTQKTLYRLNPTNLSRTAALKDLPRQLQLEPGAVEKGCLEAVDEQG